MARRSDPERIRHAKLIGSITAVHDLVVLAPPEVVATHRAGWPELRERLGRAFEAAGLEDEDQSYGLGTSPAHQAAASARSSSDAPE